MSPRESVEKSLGILKGNLSNVPESKKTNLVDKVCIEVFVKDNEKEVIAAFRDKGIGLNRDEMPNTILSLNKDNKLKKLYVMGQYGQGGGTTCEHSTYTVIITKKINSPSTNFTIIRYNDLRDDPYFKDGKWEYIVMEDKLPPSILDSSFEPGTLVIHVDYHSSVAKAFINYYNLLDQILFDPPMPFWLYYNKWSKGSRRSLFGARRRLETDKNTQNEEIIVPLKERGDIKIRYYLLPHGEKTSEKFADDRNPIVITFNGQTQGTLPRSIIKEQCKLGYLYNSLIIQIDCDNLSTLGRRFVFTSTRDKIKEEADKFFTELIAKEIGENEKLKYENQKREQEFLASRIQKSSIEMKTKLAEMLNRILPGKFKFITDSSGKGVGGVGKIGGNKYNRKILPPLPTKPEPTYLKIVNKKAPIELPINSTCLLKLESDAPNDAFEKGWRLEIDKKEIELVSHTSFKGGRSKCKIKPVEKTKIGSAFELRANLFNNGTSILSNTRLVVIVKPREGSKNKVIQINAPEIIPVYENDAYYKDNNWTEKSIADVVEGACITVYVSMENQWLQNTISKLKYTPARIDKFKQDYLLHIAFHAFIQNEDFKNMTDLNDDSKEELRVSELNRAARTVLTTLSSEGSVSP
jgi:hypothetical protein